jgi:SAM-dependent methyltransferase
MAMDKSQFEKFLNERISLLPENVVGYVRRYWWEIFSPENYKKIRANMDKQGIKPDVVDIGCGAGFGSEFFLDGSYIGIDRSYPHVGFGEVTSQLGNQFFNDGKKNVSYRIDTFPSKTIAKILKKKTLISSMSLGASGEHLSKGVEETFERYCKCMANAENLYICGPKKFTNYASDFFGGSTKIDEHLDVSGEYCAVCPIIHVKP